MSINTNHGLLITKTWSYYPKIEETFGCLLSGWAGWNLEDRDNLLKTINVYDNKIR